MYAEDLKLDHRERNGEKYEGYGHGKTLGTGMEELLDKYFKPKEVQTDECDLEIPTNG